MICIRFCSRGCMLCSVKSNHVLWKQVFQISLQKSQFFGDEFLTTSYRWRRSSWRSSCCREVHMRVFSRGRQYIRLFFQPSSENCHFTTKKVLTLLHCKWNGFCLIGFCRCWRHGGWLLVWSSSIVLMMMRLLLLYLSPPYVLIINVLIPSATNLLPLRSGNLIPTSINHNSHSSPFMILLDDDNSLVCGLSDHFHTPFSLWQLPTCLLYWSESWSVQNLLCVRRLSGFQHTIVD